MIYGFESLLKPIYTAIYSIRGWKREILYLSEVELLLTISAIAFSKSKLILSDNHGLKDCCVHSKIDFSN